MAEHTLSPDLKSLTPHLKRVWSTGDDHLYLRYLDSGNRKRPRRELEALWSSHNWEGKDSTIVLAEYLEVIGIRTSQFHTSNGLANQLERNRRRSASLRQPLGE